MMMMLYCRYKELNIRSSGMYRQYSSNVCPFLRDRPRDIIQHVMSRYRDGQAITAENIVVRGKGVFTVTSSKDDNVLYTVCFDSNGMPSCECFDWRRHHLPCKHFCAVFNLHEDYTWDALPVSYRESPFFRLDEDVVGSCDRMHCNDNAVEFSDDTSDTVIVDVNNNDQLQHIASKSAACRELLSQLINCTYLIADSSVLDQLHSTLQSTYETLLKSTPVEGGLLLRTHEDSQESFSHFGSDSDILMFSAGCCCILVTMAMCLINNDNQHRVAHF